MSRPSTSTSVDMYCSPPNSLMTRVCAESISASCLKILSASGPSFGGQLTYAPLPGLEIGLRFAQSLTTARGTDGRFSRLGASKCIFHRVLIGYSDFGDS